MKVLALVFICLLLGAAFAEGDEDKLKIEVHIKKAKRRTPMEVLKDL